MDMVRWLGDLTANDLAAVGGKACNLGEMIRAGLPVPQGFMVTTEAYRAFVAENGLARTIAQWVAGAKAENPVSEAEEPATKAEEQKAGGKTPVDVAGYDRAAEAIQAAFATGRIPDSVRQSILTAYAGLGEGPVAVRSSATAEDLPGASFAGQQETYLYQEGADAVLACVKRCWASLWTARAIAYRNHLGLQAEDVSLAVVVQRMVPATAAGVLFTANPVNGRRDQLIINAAWGLGEAVVGGQVNPDQWVVDGATGAVLEERLASKEVMTVRAAGGTTITPVPEGLRDKPVLNERGLKALAELGRKAATHFGAPQDIEWASDGDQFHLVQSRPITSLFPLPQPLPGATGPRKSMVPCATSPSPPRCPAPEPSDDLRVYICHTLIQGVTEPFTPMGLSILAGVLKVNRAVNGAQLEPAGITPVAKVAAGRLLIDVTDALRHKLLGPKLLFILGRVEPVTASILHELVKREPGLAFRKQGFPKAPMSFGQGLKVLGEMIRAMVSPDTVRLRAIARIEASIAVLEEEARSLCDPQAPAGTRFLVDPAAGRDFALRAIEGLLSLLFPLYAPLGVGMLGQEGAEMLLRKWLGDAGGLSSVVRSLPHNPTTEMDLSLWRLSRILKAEGVEPAPDHPAVRAFLEQYGHRAVRELDVGVPRWREHPAYILEVLRTYMAHGEEADAGERFREGEAAAEAAAGELVARVRRRRGRLKAWLMRHLLRWLRSLDGLRESPKFYTIRLLAAIRGVLLGVGEGLAAAGLLNRGEDVFWLHLSELEPDTGNRVDLKELVQSRRAEYDRELGRRMVPRVVTSTGETLYGSGSMTQRPEEHVEFQEELSCACIKGAPASPGVYEGIVRVIIDPTGARLERGEILVAPGTDPAWTPLFFSAGALVTETGGSMSHGSVVARECGIPAVVGVAGATKCLETGRKIRVDGGSGTIVLI